MFCIEIDPFGKGKSEENRFSTRFYVVKIRFYGVQSNTPRHHCLNQNCITLWFTTELNDNVVCNEIVRPYVVPRLTKLWCSKKLNDIFVCNISKRCYGVQQNCTTLWCAAKLWFAAKLNGFFAMLSRQFYDAIN